MSQIGIAVGHHFETAHRLPHLPGKCVSLHGHTWRVTWNLTGTPDPATGIIADYADLKPLLRNWIDINLDHGTMLGSRDPLVSALTSHNTKVFTFGDNDLTAFPWPTVEAVADLLHRVAVQLLRPVPHVDVSAVTVRETADNSATAHLPA